MCMYNYIYLNKKSQTVLHYFTNKPLFSRIHIGICWNNGNNKIKTCNVIFHRRILVYWNIVGGRHVKTYPPDQSNHLLWETQTCNMSADCSTVSIVNTIRTQIRRVNHPPSISCVVCGLILHNWSIQYHAITSFKINGIKQYIKYKMYHSIKLTPSHIRWSHVI